MVKWIKKGETWDDIGGFPTLVWDCEQCGERRTGIREPDDCINCRKEINKHHEEEFAAGIL